MVKVDVDCCSMASSSTCSLDPSKGMMTCRQLAVNLHRLLVAALPSLSDVRNLQQSGARRWEARKM